jgi:hypothetical protein
VLTGVYGAAGALRRAGHPGLRLMLLAIGDPSELRDVEGVPAEPPPWVTVRGVVAPAEALAYERAADVLVGEGTSTMHEGAALRTPLVLVPGPLREATLLATRLGEEGAAHVLPIGEVTPEALAATFGAVLAGGAGQEAMVGRAFPLATGGGGVVAAARRVRPLGRRVTRTPCRALLGRRRTVPGIDPGRGSARADAAGRPRTTTRGG